MKPFLAVKDFAKHQHYKDRRPPWIKLYAALLTDPGFLMLPEAAQAQLVKLWLLASQFGHPLPNQPKLLSGKIGTTGKFYLPVLIDAGFLVECATKAEADAIAGNTDAASEPIAESVSLAGADTPSRQRTENREQRTDQQQPSSSASANVEKSGTAVEIAPVHLGPTAGERSLALKLGSDADRIALAAICARVPAPTTVIAELNACLDGMPGHAALTPERLGHAIREFTGNGGLENFNFTNFRRYLQRAATRLEPSSEAETAGSGGNGSGSRRPPSGSDLAGEAGHVLAKIKGLRQVVNTPSGQREFIRRTDVEAMGTGDQPVLGVLAAYDAVGGADAILKGDATRWGLLVRDFANALAYARKPGVETNSGGV